MTGLQIGGVRAYLRAGVPDAEYNWSLLMGLTNISVDIQNIVKRAVVEGQIQSEHKYNNPMGEPILTAVHNRRADGEAPAAAEDDEDDAKDEHQPTKTVGAVRKEGALAALPPISGKNRFGRQLRGGIGRASNRGRGGIRLLRGKSAMYAGLPVCHVCQSNSHAHKGCPKTRTNKSVVKLEA